MPFVRVLPAKLNLLHLSFAGMQRAAMPPLICQAQSVAVSYFHLPIDNQKNCVDVENRVHTERLAYPSSIAQRGKERKPAPCLSRLSSSAPVSAAWQRPSAWGRPAMEVTVLDKSRQPGGLLFEYQAGGFRWDVAPSPFFSRALLEALFDDVGGTWATICACSQLIRGRVISFPMAASVDIRRDWARTAAELAPLGPEAVAGALRFLAFARRSPSNALAWLRSGSQFRNWLRAGPLRSAYGVCRRFVRAEKLRHALASCRRS